MERRQFLSSGAGLTAGAYLASLIDDEPLAMKRQLAASQASEIHVNHFETTAERLGNEVVRVPSPALLETSLASFRDARLFAKESRRGPIHNRVLSSNAKLASVVGLILFDSNNFSAAEQWYRTARNAASEAGDQYLSDIALASQAYIPTYSSDPAGVLSLLVPRLEARASKNPAIAWQWAFCGKAYAALGNRGRAEHAFDQSERVLGESPSETIKSGIFSFVPEKLAMYRAQAYVSLCLPDEAIGAANHALSLYDPNETTEPSLARIELASALLRAGEVDEACVQAKAAIEGPSVFVNVSVRNSARRFNSELPNTRSAAITDWKDTLWLAAA